MQTCVDKHVAPGMGHAGQTDRKYWVCEKSVGDGVSRRIPMKPARSLTTDLTPKGLPLAKVFAGQLLKLANR